MMIDIHRNYDDHEPVFLGTVKVGTFPSDLSEEQVCELIDELWERFQAAEPDSDSEFIGYLVVERPDLFASAQANRQHYVG